MTYETKMFFRLAAPALLVFAAGMVLATLAMTVSDLPVRLGGNAVYPGLADNIALATGMSSLAVYLWQMHRYWRWTKGRGELCFVCTCLLGRQRGGRFGPYRKCLGCGKNHAMAR